MVNRDKMKGNLLIGILMLVLLSSFVSGDLIQGNADGSQNGDWNSNWGATGEAGIEFKANGTYLPSQIEMMFVKLNGASTGTAGIELWTDGGATWGSYITTLFTLDVSTLNESSDLFGDCPAQGCDLSTLFNVTSNFTLQSDVDYWIVVDLNTSVQKLLWFTDANDCSATGTDYSGSDYRRGDGATPSLCPYFLIYDELVNFTITAVDNSTLEPILNFTANVSGTIYNTTTGIIITNINESQTANITLESDNYFNTTYLNYNTSTNLEGFLDPETLIDFILLTPNASTTSDNTFNITYTEAISPTNKSVNYTINTYYSTGDLKETFVTTNLSYLLNITSYNSGVYTISVNAKENNTLVSHEHNSTLAIDFLNYAFFQDAVALTPLVNKNVTITYPSSNEVTLITDAEGKVNFSSFFTSSMELGIYDITFQGVGGFATPITFQFNGTTTNMPFNITYNISQTTINVNIFYRSNGSIFNKDARVIIQGLINTTTNNGSVILTNTSIASQDYIFQVFSDGFFTEQRVVTYDSQTNLDVSFFMLESTENNSNTITVLVTDGSQSRLADAQVILQEYDEPTLSYSQVSECFTDSQGECTFLIETDVKTYIVQAFKTVNNVQLSSTTGQAGIIFRDDIVSGQGFIFSDKTLTLTLSALTPFTYLFDKFLEYDIDENFNNDTNISQVSIEYLMTDGTDITVCIGYYVVGIVTKENVLTKCVTSPSATVTPDVPVLLNRSKDYLVEVYVNQSNSKTILEEFRYSKITSFEQMLRDGAIASPFMLGFWVIINSVSLYASSIPLLGFLSIALSIFETFLFPSFTVGAGTVLRILLAVQLIYFGRKREDFQ